MAVLSTGSRIRAEQAWDARVVKPRREREAAERRKAETLTREFMAEIEADRQAEAERATEPAPAPLDEMAAKVRELSLRAELLSGTPGSRPPLPTPEQYRRADVKRRFRLQWESGASEDELVDWLLS